jgi:phosphonoacetaldehyde hydrolase
MSGRLRAVVFDWAGTTIDFGSLAPMGVFVRAFAEFGVPLTVAQARGPMGRPKRDHVAALMALPEVARAWRARHGHAPGEVDIDRVYAVFVPMNVAVAADHATLVPGVPALVRALRARGLAIGSTTGYTREIMAPILPRAAAAGYAPDTLMCAGDLPEGRPGPAMMVRTMADLGVDAPSAVVKVDDTAPGLAEGLAAGTWTVGVTASGNEVGRSWDEWQAMPAAERREALERAGRVLREAGAHYLVETVADLLPVLDDIERRLAAGEVPSTRS